MLEGQLPLSGILVIDAATFIAAPYSAAILGEFGAEVIKVEQPGSGDPLRQFGTPAEGDDTYCWLSEARNKKSITLNLSRPEGAALFRRLVVSADVVCENFRPGTLEKWGLGYEALQEINDRLVLLRISGFGQDGPYRNRPGFARIAHAFGGLAQMTGIPGGPPLTPGSTSLADYVSGLYGAIGILMAIRAREVTGRGQVIDLALYEPILRMLDDIVPAYAAKGIVRDRLGLHTSNACPHGHFQSSDGCWMAIACTSDKMFERLARVMARPDLADPDRYGRAATRIADSEAVNRLVADWVGARTRDQVQDACLAGEVPCASVNTIADIFDDPHVRERGNLLRVSDEAVGEVVVVPAAMPRLSDTPGRVVSLGPSLGNANREVYCDRLGLSEDEFQDLSRRGII
jgi:crotonobetainyl-CoA:carnitine CoA-transferase CaiB-like acyl-CoA transferase